MPGRAMITLRVLVQSHGCSNHFSSVVSVSTATVFVIFFAKVLMLEFNVFFCISWQLALCRVH